MIIISTLIHTENVNLERGARGRRGGRDGSKVPQTHLLVRDYAIIKEYLVFRKRARELYRFESQ